MHKAATKGARGSRKEQGRKGVRDKRGSKAWKDPQTTSHPQKAVRSERKRIHYNLPASIAMFLASVSNPPSTSRVSPFYALPRTLTSPHPGCPPSPPSAQHTFPSTACHCSQPGQLTPPQELPSQGFLWLPQLLPVLHRQPAREGWKWEWECVCVCARVCACVCVRARVFVCV